MCVCVSFAHTRIHTGEYKNGVPIFVRSTDVSVLSLSFFLSLGVVTQSVLWLLFTDINHDWE